MKDTFSESQDDEITLPYDLECELNFSLFFFCIEVVVITTKRKKLTIAVARWYVRTN